MLLAFRRFLTRNIVCLSTSFLKSHDFEFNLEEAGASNAFNSELPEQK